MSDATPLDRYDRAAATATAVVGTVRADQYDDPTPCTEWTVRQLLNHLIGGNKSFVARVTDGAAVDRGADHVGPDHIASFEASVAELRAAFAADGVLDRVFPGPLGDAPGRALVNMRVNEFMVHAWDLARATGQSTDLDPELAAESLADFERLQDSGRGGAMFAPRQAYPPDATVADRLAATAGRSLS
jgi:uncharacterized protein (TIGR03086 family)